MNETCLVLLVDWTRELSVFLIQYNIFSESACCFINAFDHLLEKYRLLLVSNLSIFSCLCHHTGPAAQLCNCFLCQCKSRYDLISLEILGAHFLKYCPECLDKDNNGWLLNIVQPWQPLALILSACHHKICMKFSHGELSHYIILNSNIVASSRFRYFGLKPYLVGAILVINHKMTKSVAPYLKAE